ncbi:hypothetical protein FSP39_011858 [Pinctada imbricata]|uniref:Chitin-binding type-2 domain-containing protein n=1 Tax=Pinctada imbricata TaxID=66713 RepID=A0AA88YCV2_PINIB|nr:hypothetical protein FSP39_011858 [Pinctada imbricata]
MFSFFYFCLVYSVVFCFVFVKSQKPCDGVIGQQFRPDPNDCRVYYLCGTGKDWNLQCGPNLVWNQKLGTCVPLGSGNDTCSQNIQSLPPLTPGPPTASLNLRSPSERRYSPFGESTWRPNCPPGSKQRFAHPTKCAQYYDCGADPRENWWGKNLRECSYPTVFDEVTGNCGYYTEVNCGRRELPLDPCDYLDHACRNSHCVPCFIKYASCTGKRNGVNVWKGREKTPFFVFCKDQRVVFHGQCVPSEPGKRHIFDPQYNTCRRPHARSPPNIHVTHNEAIHATPEGPIGPQLSPGPGPHRMTPFGHADIPPNMHTNMSVGNVKVVITTPAPQQKQPPQPNPNQSPPQGFGQTNNNVPTAQGQQQNQPMQQKPQNQGQQTPSFSMPQNNQRQPQVSRQNNQNQGFQQSQTGQNPGFQFNNNKQPQVQNNNFQSNMNQNNNQNNNNNNNGMWQPKTTRQPQPFTNWPGSFGQPSKPNNPQQSSFSGNGAEAAWLQFNAGKPTNGNSQSVNMQQKQTSTFMIDNNSPGMMTKNTEQHMTIMQPNSQGPAQQNSQAGQQQPFQQQNAPAGIQQQQNQVQSGGYQKSFQQQQQTQANNNQAGNQAPNQNFQPQQQQNNIGSNQYQQQPSNQGGFQQKITVDIKSSNNCSKIPKEDYNNKVVSSSHKNTDKAFGKQVQGVHNRNISTSNRIPNNNNNQTTTKLVLTYKIHSNK